MHAGFLSSENFSVIIAAALIIIMLFMCSMFNNFEKDQQHKTYYNVISDDVSKSKEISFYTVVGGIAVLAIIVAICLTCWE